jgi:hypothetical protein
MHRRSSPLTTAGPDDTSLNRLSVLDWIGVLLVAASALVSLVVPIVVAPMFGRLSESLGSPPPSPGRWLLQGWVPVALGVGPLVLVGYALAVRQSIIRRRVLLVLAFALTVLAGVVFLFALYTTLFSMAGAPTG